MDHNKMDHENMSHMSHTDHEKAMTDPSMAKAMEKDMKDRFFWSLAFTIPIILYSPIFTGLFKVQLPTPIPINWLLLILTTPIVFKFGSIFPIGAYQALRKKTLNMMVLIAIGVLTAYVFSVFITFIGGETFFDAAAMLVTFVLFGHWMEMKSRRGTSDALRALFNLVPPQARVIRDGKETLLATSEVIIGDIMVLKPGDKVAVDGEVLTGETSIDESLVTGESIPVLKKEGDRVIGGTINQTGSITFKATKVGSDTALAQIVKLVETAQNSKAPGQRLADKAAQYLVILAVGAGLVTFIYWYFFAGKDLLMAIMFAVSAIVVACPDALGLATPTAVAVGTGLGAKHNILIKDASTLEQTSKIQVVVMDKTGTLTEGKPKVTDIIPVKDPYTAVDQLLKLAASVESRSNHPLSSALVDTANEKKLALSEVERFSSISGHGIEAIVEGKHVLVGNLKLMKDRGVDPSLLQSEIDKLLNDGKTLILIAIDGKMGGVVAVADPIKETAQKAITRMKELGLEVVMITGDNKKTAESIGKQLGIDRIFAEVLPEDKANYVIKLQKEHKFVAMVGDGVNDAPALAQADIGIAIGAGTDVAIETANIVLMKSDPADILRAIRLSKATVTKMKQNLVWASVYNVLAIPIAAGVLYPQFGITLRPEFSALLMSASSIIVAVNAVLLKGAEKDLITI